MNDGCPNTFVVPVIVVEMPTESRTLIVGCPSTLVDPVMMLEIPEAVGMDTVGWPRTLKEPVTVEGNIVRKFSKPSVCPWAFAMNTPLCFSVSCAPTWFAGCEPEHETETWTTQTVWTETWTARNENETETWTARNESAESWTAHRNSAACQMF